LGKLIIPNCETYEQLYPVRFLEHELRCDAADAGEFRGGSGAVYRVLVEDEAEYAFRGEGQRTPSGYGVHGGGTGMAGSVEFVGTDGISWVPPQFGTGRLGPVEIRIDSPAGGGWGNPKERDPQQVLRDVRDGLVSEAAARALYGVVLSADQRRVDVTATEDIRRE
jgi:N-methylhydantoinase B